MVDLPPEIAEKVAEALLEQYSVWYSPKVEPWQDREGILLDACNLARAAGGDENCAAAQVASHLFSALSPHLGCTARGTGPLSSAADMKALLKYWRIPQGGKKDEMQARIREEVEVAKVLVIRDGVTVLAIPAHSRVSVAAFRVLRKSARDTERISQSKCKDIFGLTKSSIKNLPSGYIWDGRTAFASKMYLLREVKAAALRGRITSLALLSACNKRAAGWRADSETARTQRAERLAEALVARGWEATGAGGAEEFAKGLWAMDHVWGNRGHLTSEAAADHCEQMQFCTSGPGAVLWAACKARSLMECPVPAGRGGLYWKMGVQNEWAAEQTVKEWARGQPSMEAITSNWRVPRSLLPKMESARA